MISPMDDKATRELKVIVIARMERLKRMYTTVGPNHGDIKLLIEQEIPALLRTLAKEQNRAILAKEAFDARVRGELSQLGLLTVLGMLFDPHQYTEYEKASIGAWAARLESEL